MSFNIPLFIKHPNSKEFSSPLLRNNPAPTIDGYVLSEIVLAGGRNKFGQPRMRVVWMQGLTRVINGQTRLKYAAQSWGDGFGKIFDIGFPRFMVEQWVDPAFVDLAHWNTKLQGPKPHQGMYLDLMCIQTADGHFCYPDRRHLTELKAMDYRKRHDALYHAADEVAPQYVRDMKVKALNDRDAAIKEKSRAQRRFITRDHFKENLHRITHKHPNEGLARDKYAESRKLREKVVA